VEWFWQAAVILGMFLLRLGVPLLITLAVGYFLRRLDAKWQAEALVLRVAQEAQAKADQKPDFELYKVIEQPCWEVKGCPEAVRAQCPAFQQPEMPCWLVRYQTGGRLPANCYRCKMFSPRPATQMQLN
jgi:hypothetical protein